MKPIWIVDDDASIRWVLEKALARENLATRSFASGREALAAFERALAIEPANPQALNNVGIVRRELGRLAESEAALRRVIELVPDMAFGHYNLGHTLFLQGRFQAALSAYAEGQVRDAERNPVQASRLALCKVATGDAHGALLDLQRATANLPRAARLELLGDVNAILWALITQHPEIYDQLEQRGKQLTGAMEKNPPPGVTVNRVGAMFTMFFTKGPVTDWESAKVADTQRFAKFFQFMLERGVYLAPSQFEAAFLSTAMTEADVAKTVGAVQEFFAQ